jgi:hypothetical protein
MGVAQLLQPKRLLQAGRQGGAMEGTSAHGRELTQPQLLH